MIKIKKPKTKHVIYTAYALILLVTVYHLYYAKRIIPGVHIGDIDAGGKTFAQTKAILLEKELENIESLKLTYQDEEFVFDQNVLDLKYNIDATIVRAFEVGRTGNLIIDTKDKLAGILKPLKIKAFYELDDSELNNQFNFIQGEVNESPQDAYYDFADDGQSLVIVPSSKGRMVDSDYLYGTVITSIEDIDFDEKSLVVDAIEPEISESLLAVHLDEVTQLVFNKLSLTYGDRTWVPSEEEMLSFVSVNIDEDGGTSVGLDSAAFEVYSDVLVQEINTLPRGRVAERSGDVVVRLEIIKEGQEVDVKNFEDQFSQSFLAAASELEIPVDTISELQDPNEYGILALIGEGTSRYTGSAPSRAHNLNLAADRASGVLVPPGEEFSFNNAVGYIDGSTGYASAYVISNGRTVLGDGGGVCQTSTTLFRAVLDSGLPITTRHPHAYRVGYYELDSQVGFDASIYQPTLDFRFRNDTAGYILVESYADQANQLLGFRLYGTPDGRTVEISDASVYNQSPPPEPLYQDDPSLPKGVVKQVDFAAWGATASFDRVVRDKDGELLYDDTFTTNYQPWRAIYLVGTKE